MGRPKMKKARHRKGAGPGTARADAGDQSFFIGQVFMPSSG